MYDKVINLVKSKDYIIPNMLFANYKKLNLTELELLVIVYLINNDTLLYNPKDIATYFNIELVDVLNLMNSLMEKGVLTIKVEARNGKKAEVLDMSSLYDKLTFLIIDKEETIDTTIYSVIEKEFARALSPLEYDLVNAWLDNGYTEELIKEALKEAIYNNVTSLKYIDKILDNWSKKGIKTKQDVINNQKKFKERKNDIKDSFDYDWLNEE